MHRVLALLAFSFVLPRPALAEPTFRVEPGGVALPLDLEDAEVCVIRPAELRDADMCEDIDVEALDKALPSPGVATAILRFEDFAATLAVVRAPASLGASSGRPVREFMQGVHKSLVDRYGSVQGRALSGRGEYDRVTLGGHPAYRSLAELPAGSNGGLDRILSYAFQSDTSLFVVTWGVSADHLEDVTAVAEATMAHLQRAAPKDSPSEAFQSGRRSGRLFGYGVLGVVGLVVIQRARRKDEKAKPPAAS